MVRDFNKFEKELALEQSRAFDELKLQVQLTPNFVLNPHIEKIKAQIKKNQDNCTYHRKFENFENKKCPCCGKRKVD